MAVDLRCPNCKDNLGKDKENTCDAHCGNCGKDFFNPVGYIEDQKHYDEVKAKYPGKKLPRPDESLDIDASYIKTFESWKLDIEIMEAEIPWASEKTRTILEGKMSEIDILAQDASTLEEFIDLFAKYIQDNAIDINIEDEETIKWLKFLYDESKERN